MYDFAVYGFYAAIIAMDYALIFMLFASSFSGLLLMIFIMPRSAIAKALSVVNFIQTLIYGD